MMRFFHQRAFDTAVRARTAVTGREGQATVEYVGLAVAIAVLLVATGNGLSGHGGSFGAAIAKRLTQAIQATK